MFQVKRNGKITGLALALAVLVATAIAAVPGIFSYVNVTTGYQFNGTAPNGEALCGDGTYYDTPCLVSGFYQIVSETGTPLTQQGTLNFDGTVVATNGLLQTNVGLPNKGTAGTYAFPISMNTDAQGRVTGVTAGPTPSQTNCLTTTCIGGSTYVAGTSYTNGAAYSVLEEVTMESGTAAETGCDYQLTPTINSVTGPVAGIFNDANGRLSATTFKVIPGATFSVTLTQVGGGGGCGSPSLAGWLEVIG